MVDPVWAGVIGAVAGGAIAAVTSLLSPLVNWNTEKKRIEAQRATALALARAEHEHKLALAAEETKHEDRTFKRALIAEWRDAVNTVHDEFIHDLETSGTYPQISPVNRVWFEKLSPHLDRNVAEVGALYEFNQTWGQGTATVIFDEIARLEREWDLV